ncbi:MAG: OmpA family protein, partial [Myxococcota bacterium]
DDDGIADALDDCPLAADPSQVDTNGDGEGDACDSDDDGDGVLDAKDNCPLAANPSQTDTDGDKLGDACDEDDDGDGLNDVIEDKDGDGVLDAGETDPLVVDTDGDGLDDGVEDFDADGVRDADETDPTLPDTDGDGIKDGVEDANKNGQVDPGETDPLKADTDGDGLADGAEDKNGNGKVDAGETSPLKADTDGDGLTDGQETSTDPLVADTDGDGLSDAVEDKNANGIVDAGETSPNLPDSDGDGIKDGVEDANQNGVFDSGETDPLNADTDGDGLVDGVEDKNGNGKVDPGETDPRVAEQPVEQLLGNGCTAGATGQAGGMLSALAVLALLLLVRLRRRPTATTAAAAVLLALTLPCTHVLAADAASVLQYRGAVTGEGLLHSDGGKLLGHLQPAVGLWTHYDRRPLTLSRAVPGGTATVYDAVASQVAGEVVAAVGLFGWAELGIVVPVVLDQTGDASPAGPGSEPTLGPGLGDVRVLPKVRLLSYGAMDLALSVAIDVPTATAAYSGSGTIDVAPRLTGSVASERFGALLTLDTLLRDVGDQSTTPAKSSGNGWQVTAGAWAGVIPRVLDVVVDSRWTLSQGALDAQRRSGEVLGGLRVSLPAGFAVTAAAGPGVGQTPGTPEFRALLGLTWVLDPNQDRDRDGVPDDVDQCPDVPEDVDGFEDGDGCVDPDNDGDGIADVSDGCRDDAEDKDGFEDADGCPELDNDGDGVFDREDACPTEPEDEDDYEDDDGCPDLDHDKDGIVDTADKCPGEYGVAAESGCPAQDTDKDGISDAADLCPARPETFNGVADEDGCPDGANKVVVTDTEVKVLEKIHFDSGRSTIMPVSYALLDAAAATLKLTPKIGRLQVEGHTDDLGDDTANLTLSQARAEAVVKYLIERGISADRLVARGFGESQPLCPDVATLVDEGAQGKKPLAACRERNHRVEFKVLELNGKPVPAPSRPGPNRASKVAVTATVAPKHGEA